MTSDDELAAIVAWLRRDIEPDFSKCVVTEDYAATCLGAAIGKATREALADAIERGEYRRT